MGDKRKELQRQKSVLFRREVGISQAVSCVAAAFREQACYGTGRGGGRIFTSEG